eukprot:2883187-Rhodomonas_salina.2
MRGCRSWSVRRERPSVGGSASAARGKGLGSCWRQNTDVSHRHRKAAKKKNDESGADLALALPVFVGRRSLVLLNLEAAQATSAPDIA